MECQTPEVSPAQLKESKNSTLAILFFLMGALHIYGAMRSRAKRHERHLMLSTKLAHKKTVLSSSPKIGLGLTVSLLAVVVIEIIEILVF
ncbi:MAG: hypothetical protein AB4038_20930 [Prochloraceae cyanobacterium]